MRTFATILLAALLAGTTLSLTGCSPPGMTLDKVSGNVTFDGQPVEEGRILFRAVEGDQRAFSGAIQNGRYELESLPGKMTVEITASRIIPGKFDESNPDEKVPMGEMYIPERYNSKTELTAEVPAGGAKDVNFTLTSE